MTDGPLLNRREAAALLGGAAAGLAACQTAVAAPENRSALQGPVVTRRSGLFNGVKVDYDAIVEPILVNDANGKPSARIVSTSYVATRQSPNRPVIFAFNGGPISASAILHMGALGPKRLAVPNDITADPVTFKVIDNTYALLDVADMVFFDPASTGLSRVLEGVDPKRYYTMIADGQQAAQFVVEWSRLHSRVDAPKYVFGESYGTIRAVSMANQLQKLPTPLSGVVLLGQALNIVEFSQRPGNIISYVVSLPTLAAAAFSHGKAQTRGRTLEQFTEDAWTFGRDEYLHALFKGRTLDASTRQRIASQLEDFTGLPSSWYLANNLRISKEAYRRELLSAEGQILGQTDARYKGPNPDGRASDPSRVVSDAYQTAFIAYLRDELCVAEAADYKHAATDVGQGLDAWDYGGRGPFADWPFPTLLNDCFAANPKFRAMVGNGYHDTQTTVGAARYLVEQASWPVERTSLHFYPGGHMAYSIEASLRRLTSDVRTTIGS
jgi:carboxypeptidase C (cathepsin A)